MEYQALYRRFRPTTFEGVVGQEHITRVLKNQVETGRTSHAYLFSGTRGTGKTSTAKILARAVNCLSPVNGEPCNECEACKTASEANVDIIELDAASNNGVDDMRALIEKAVFAPVKLRKKVYIIDEAHMLSGAAFNALLKTLEEPPAHVLFILATTEPHKIIPTITSRCQRFDFRRLSAHDIVACLESVIKSAGASIDKEGLEIIARKANGGMRDALSLADQCISFCGNNVSAADVNAILGSADFDTVYNMAELLINGDAPGILRLLDETIQGRDIAVIMQDLTAHLRSLLLAKLCGSCSDILDCTEDDMQKLIKQAKNASEERLTRAIQILTKAQSDLKYYPQPRILTETALVKVCRPETETDISSVLDRIDVLEKSIKEGPRPSKSESMKETDISSALERIEALERRISDGTVLIGGHDEEKASVPKEAKPKKKKVIASDAREVFEKLCAELNKTTLGMFIMISIKSAVDIELSDSVLSIIFNDKIHHSTVKANEEKLSETLKNLGYELTVRAILKETDAADGIEESLMEVFGDMDVVD